MTLSEISNIRLKNQKISDASNDDIKNIVYRMGAMQAQEFGMSKWALGIRSLNSTEQLINNAINNGEIIRTHVMRPTWHYVSPEDIYWMLDLTAHRIKNSMRARNRELELTEEVFTKCRNIIEKAFSTKKSITREEFGSEFNRSGINTDNNRLSHILFEFELNKIICSGEIQGTKPTYSLLTEKVPVKKTLNKEESLAELAKRYFTSHGPATIKDFAWWSGLPLGEARKGLETVKNHFVSEDINHKTYWFSDNSLTNVPEYTFFLLPAFDEFLISYNDRSASLLDVFSKKTISINGMFYPIVVVNGQVCGLWKRTVKKDKVIIETNLFDKSLSKKLKHSINESANKFGSFLNKETEVVIN